MSASPVGFFQFDNLVRNRVPFFLLKTADIDVESLFSPVDVMEKMHLRNFSLDLSSFSLTEAEQLLQQRLVPKEAPLVVLDNDGSASAKLASELAADGFVNVYFIPGGFRELLAGKAAP